MQYALIQPKWSKNESKQKQKNINVLMYQHLQGYDTISRVKSMGSTLKISHSASNTKFFISSKLIQIKAKPQPGYLLGNLIAYPTCTCVNFVQYPPLSFERITGKGGRKPTLFIFARVKQGGSIKVRTRCPKSTSKVCWHRCYQGTRINTSQNHAWSSAFLLQMFLYKLEVCSVSIFLFWGQL